MWKLSLAVVGVLATIAAVSAPSLIARQQNAARFEYLFVTPHTIHLPGTFNSSPGVVSRQAYRACVAGTEDWTCREFAPADRDTREGDVALRDMLAMLGNEGWELVSAVDDTPDRDSGMTYVFKRQP